MGTDSLKLEFIQDFLAADIDESFITRLKKELKDFCSSKKSGTYPLPSWESMSLKEREAFYETAEQQVLNGQTKTHEDVKKWLNNGNEGRKRAISIIKCVDRIINCRQDSSILKELLK